ncbi:hypothetical protein DFH08DRAFT_940133 [Mycena albidolilacea]|uniref:Uncharacterized protein n=1 Tax=Mycena albidolilacea TaxID=1033008 RepID=A0AAD6ZQH0_9AGAR|nr:hypothetical protein DFH08DRAFT_940133 [Mycena albidolilacea]
MEKVRLEYHQCDSTTPTPTTLSREQPLSGTACGYGGDVVEDIGADKGAATGGDTGVWHGGAAAGAAKRLVAGVAAEEVDGSVDSERDGCANAQRRCAERAQVEAGRGGAGVTAHGSVREQCGRGAGRACRKSAAVRWMRDGSQRMCSARGEGGEAVVTWRVRRGRAGGTGIRVRRWTTGREAGVGAVAPQSAQKRGALALDAKREACVEMDGDGSGAGLLGEEGPWQWRERHTDRGRWLVGQRAAGTEAGGGSTWSQTARGGRRLRSKWTGLVPVTAAGHAMRTDFLGRERRGRRHTGWAGQAVDGRSGADTAGAQGAQ